MDNEAFQLIIYCLVNAFGTCKMRRLEQALARTRLGTAHYLVYWGGGGGGGGIEKKLGGGL